MNETLTFLSDSESDTDVLGQAFGHAVSQGLCIALDGQLGSGKTRFVRSLCDGLGCDTSQVNSPTFVLVQLYVDGRLPVAHMDTYRLGDSEEFISIGADEYLHSDEWLCLVEWADRVNEKLPADRLTVAIFQTGENSRRFDITCTGPRSGAVLSMLRKDPNLARRIAFGGS